MAHYQRIGFVPPKRHTQHRTEDGTLLFEELMGEEGFSSDSSLLYHRHLPSAVVEARSRRRAVSAAAAPSPRRAWMSVSLSSVTRSSGRLATAASR